MSEGHFSSNGPVDHSRHCRQLLITHRQCIGLSTADVQPATTLLPVRLASPSVQSVLLAFAPSHYFNTSMTAHALRKRHSHTDMAQALPRHAAAASASEDFVALSMPWPTHRVMVSCCLQLRCLSTRPLEAQWAC